MKTNSHGKYTRAHVSRDVGYRDHRRHTQTLLASNSPNNVNRALLGRPAPVVKAAAIIHSLFCTAPLPQTVFGTEERAWQAAWWALLVRQRGARRASQQLHGHQHHIHAAHYMHARGGHGVSFAFHPFETAGIYENASSSVRQHGTIDGRGN